jgi:NADPH-dependent 2,4-dienoyl-CoA reductase/sulfur reductase-like enzyme/rhodanese-related sulfurtransferase
MSSPRILVLGASAAGLKAAVRARRLLPGASITVVDRREVVSFGACGLPAYLGGDVDEVDALRRTGWGALRDAAFFRTVKGIEVMTGWRALAIDRDAHAVMVERADGPPGEGSGRHMLLYDKLVYALGAAPRTPEGVEPGGAIGHLTAPEEATALREALQTGAVASCVVLGGGALGTETAAVLADVWGCEVTLLEQADHVLPSRLDPELASVVAASVRRAGVDVRTGVAVTGARTDADGRARVALATGEELVADRALVALGAVPRTRLARAAGLAVGDLGGLVVDAHLRTVDPDILGAGDCLELVHHVSGEIVRHPLGSLANRQGRVVGDVLAGLPSEFPAVIGSSAVPILDLHVASTGLTARAAEGAGFAVETVRGAFHDRTDFHPERQNVYFTLVFERGSERLLGLQGVGPGEVVKRVDVFAALLRADAGLDDLLDTEWCYAPRYNSPLDPLQQLAATARNLDHCRLGQTPVAEDGGAAGRLILDVRSAEEFAAQQPPSPPGAVNIPLEELRDRAGEVPAERPVLVLCARGPRSFEAARILQERGCGDVVYLAGGVHLQHDAAAG